MDELYKLLGQICVNFQQIEFRLKRIIWCLIDCKNGNVGSVVTTRIAYKDLPNLLKALLSERKLPSGITHKLMEIANEANGLESYRNKMIHSAWVVGAHDNQIYSVKMTIKNGALSETPERLDLQEVNGFNSRCQSLEDKMEEFHQKFGSEFLSMLSET